VRFYAPDIPVDGTPVSLPQDEAHHLAHVMRLGVGRSVHVFDGRGHEYRAEILEVSRRGVVVRPIERVEAARESALRGVLAPAVLKGDHMDAVVRDATMMGVAEIVPVLTDHVVVPARALAGSGPGSRWWRVALGAAKQCGRAVVPSISPPARLAEIVRPGTPTVMLVEPRCTGQSATGIAALARDRREVLLLVGPEGGWSEAELAAAAEAGVHRWSLGPRTLRADSAAMVALSILGYLSGWTAPPAAARPDAG